MIGQIFTFPPEQQHARKRAARLAWLSIVLLVSGATLLGLVLGQSQAMKTAWVSDVLTAIPPIALLVAMRFELKPPSKRFPFGHLRSISIAFLVTASILSLIGIYLLFDSVSKLLRHDRPPIGTLTLFGHQFWLGWAMIAALTYSMCVGILIGALKKPVAKKLNDKELEAESRMNRDEWLSEGAAILGIILVGYGHWWGDATAAAFISIEIIMDGWHNMRQVIADLMDESPTIMGKSELDDIPEKLRRAAEQLPWVDRAAVRLREQGHAITGEIFVVPRADAKLSAEELVARVESSADDFCNEDWRLHDLIVMPVHRLDAETPPRASLPR